AEAPTPLLGRVFEINRRISLLQDVDQILEVIIDSAIEFTGAERGSLILQEDGVSTVKVTRGMDLPARGAHPEGFSHSLIEEVCATGEPIITIDAATDQRFSASVSVQDLQLRSVICLPFRLRQAIIGVLYLENRLQRAVFSETNIPLLHAFMDQAAIAISNAWIFDELKKSAANIQQLNEQLRHALSEKEIELGQARDTLAVKQAALELKYRYDEIVGRSPPMMAALKILDRVTESDVPVFLYGESGTGKELIARAIHFNGPRAKMPFVPVNCSAIPETLIEAELFGYARGAFTGAERSHAGVFERAQSGTLFLDEIGDMPLAMQAKLLRVLEDGVFQPLGSPATTTVDVRLLTASNKDLRDLVAQKTFREDLFFRIHQIRIALPPLRERKEDLPLLINHFIEKIATETAGEKKTLSPSALGLFTAYDWPGNIRELENTLRNACLLAEGPQIGPEDLRHKEELFLASASRSAPGDTEHSLDDAVACFEAALVRKTLEQCRGNVSRTARHLGIPRPRLYRLMRRFRITAEAVH
ncbi:MAG: sigma-54-dependent Fis family transcriptional regulator, partial [Deltaproteobacteria bacterium]|nr:sigma-54-dependent Fis family transcriptional regulator [Deltaproteobacteria bacterium]